MPNGSPSTDLRPRSRWDKLRYGGVGLLVGLVIGALATGYVYVEGRERLAALDARHAAQAVEAQAGLTSVRQDLAAARAFESLLRARIAADEALAALDQSNFGLSREHLRSVGVALAEVDPALVSVDPAALAAAQELVKTTLAQVAPDALTQRDRLREVVRAVDGLIPRAPLG